MLFDAIMDRTASPNAAKVARVMILRPWVLRSKTQRVVALKRVRRMMLSVMVLVLQVLVPELLGVANVVKDKVATRASKRLPVGKRMNGWKWCEKSVLCRGLIIR